MQAKDLRVAAPRRWNVTVDGIPWLPRLIDKARAAQAGTLGGYLYGQSPMDHECLKTFGVRHREFAQIVAASSDDDAVLASLAERDPESIARAKAWSRDFERRHAWFLHLLDLDDGYATGPLRVVKPAVNVLANSFTWAVKRIWPSRAVERSRS